MEGDIWSDLPGFIVDKGIDGSAPIQNDQVYLFNDIFLNFTML